jgi:lysozyme family protein
MAIADYLPCEKRIIDSEGTKYTDGVNPYDPGGPTRYGITLKDARLHWKRNATAEDVRLMPISVALAIYKSKYWDAMNCDALPPGIDYTVMDYGVNSGIGRSGKVLRRLVGLPDNTSKITPEVVDAVNKRDVAALIHAMNNERLRFLQSLKIWPTYKNGWTVRVRGVDAYSIKLWSDPTTAANSPTLEVPKATLPGATEGPVPLPQERPADAGEGPKGVVPEPKTTKTVLKTATGTGAPTVTWHWWDWIAAHPAASVTIAVCAGVLVFVAFKALRDWHAAKQEAPTSGIAVVPVKA